MDTGLVAVFDGRHYLSELGMRRAANMSRVLPSVIRSRHGAGAYCTANFSLGGPNIRNSLCDPGSAPTSLRPARVGGSSIRSEAAWSPRQRA